MSSLVAGLSGCVELCPAQIAFEIVALDDWQEGLDEDTFRVRVKVDTEQGIFEQETWCSLFDDVAALVGLVKRRWEGTLTIGEMALQLKPRPDSDLYEVVVLGLEKRVSFIIRDEDLIQATRSIVHGLPRLLGDMLRPILFPPQ